MPSYIVKLRDIEGDPRIMILRQMYKEGKLDIHQFAHRLRQTQES